MIYSKLFNLILMFVLPQKMLRLIKERVESKRCDDILEVAWSAMWNVTDETAINCARFLSNGGMELFLDCLSVSVF